MAVVAREAWTDERLDDLNKKVDVGFTDMRAELRAIRAEIGGEFQGVRGEIAPLNRHLMQLTWGLSGSMLIGFLGTIIAVVTQM
jgi:hypothetical protein